MSKFTECSTEMSSVRWQMVSIEYPTEEQKNSIKKISIIERDLGTTAHIEYISGECEDIYVDWEFHELPIGTVISPDNYCIVILGRRGEDNIRRFKCLNI